MTTSCRKNYFFERLSCDAQDSRQRAIEHGFHFSLHNDLCNGLENCVSKTDKLFVKNCIYLLIGFSTNLSQFDSFRLIYFYKCTQNSTFL